MTDETPRQVVVSLFDEIEGCGGWPPTKVVDMIKWLEGFLEQVPAEHRAEAEIDIHSVSQYGDPAATVCVSYRRPETSEEIADRVACSHRAALEREERLRVEFQAQQRVVEAIRSRMAQSK